MIFYAYFIQNEKLIFEIEEITNWMNAGHSPPKRHVVKKNDPQKTCNTWTNTQGHRTAVIADVDNYLFIYFYLYL